MVYYLKNVSLNKAGVHLNTHSISWDTQSSHNSSNQALLAERYKVLYKY